MTTRQGRLNRPGQPIERTEQETADKIKRLMAQFYEVLGACLISDYQGEAWAKVTFYDGQIARIVIGRDEVSK